MSTEQQGADFGELTIRFEMTSGQAAAFLGRLAYDDAFRARLVGSQEEANAALSEYGITYSGESLTREGTAYGPYYLPTKKHIQTVLRQITYPDPDPPQFGMCKFWAMAAYAAAAVDPNEPAG